MLWLNFLSYYLIMSIITCMLFKCRYQIVSKIWVYSKIIVIQCSDFYYSEGSRLHLSNSSFQHGATNNVYLLVCDLSIINLFISSGRDKSRKCRQKSCAGRKNGEKSGNYRHVETSKLIVSLHVQVH